jgi:hypothetical protein
MINQKELKIIFSLKSVCLLLLGFLNLDFYLFVGIKVVNSVDKIDSFEL